MKNCRNVPFLTFVTSPYNKVKVSLAGCNFNCKGCFAIAKQETGRNLTVTGLIGLLAKSSQVVCAGVLDDVQFTGGEPTINLKYLLCLIRQLRKKEVKRIGISTNGHLLDEKLVKELSSLNVDYIKLDLKAYTNRIHKWYTGQSNTNVLKAVSLLSKYRLNFYVRTIFIPGIIDIPEVENIAKFLSGIDRTINYKIYQFAPEQLNANISRIPTEKEILKASNVARTYLDNVEFYTTITAYKPAHKFVEVRADGLLENFKMIDKISQKVIPRWNMEYLTMNQVLKWKENAKGGCLTIDRISKGSEGEIPSAAPQR